MEFAFKEDTTFRGLRDVIKKCNKVLDSMLVRRERKYTLMFRIVGVGDAKLLKKISHWNVRVEKALGGVVTTSESEDQSLGSSASAAASSWRSNRQSSRVDDADDASSVSSASSARSSVSAVFRRGRELLPTAGKVRARRATPTPRLRRKNRNRDEDEDGASSPGAGEDGYSSDTRPMMTTMDSLAGLQLSLDTGVGGGDGVGDHQRNGSPPKISELHGDKKKKSNPAAATAGLGAVKPMKPKDELLDVIRGLRTEQKRARESMGPGGEHGRTNANVLDEIKSNFTPKAEMPSAVPKLPTEYIHRHRLMKQVVNCLLDRATGPRDMDDDSPFANSITCITSRHSDKAGNGKTTLAVAAMQTVEVREFFSDGIAWIHLGRMPLGEREVRRLYEQLYNQLLGGEEDSGEDDVDGAGKDDDDNASNSSSSADEKPDGNNTTTTLDEDTQRQHQQRNKDPPGKGVSNINGVGAGGGPAEVTKLATSRRSFQSGELEGMKEDLGRLLRSRRVLICLDDVCKMEDAKWFLFDTRSDDGVGNFEDTTHRVLITTRIPGLVGPGITHEVFVRIFSEHGRYIKRVFVPLETKSRLNCQMFTCFLQPFIMHACLLCSWHRIGQLPHSPEAVKLLLTAAGRRPNGLPKTSPVFAQARIIVKGCGNSPLALREC